MKNKEVNNLLTEAGENTVHVTKNKNRRWGGGYWSGERRRETERDCLRFFRAVDTDILNVVVERRCRFYPNRLLSSKYERTL